MGRSGRVLSLVEKECFKNGFPFFLMKICSKKEGALASVFQQTSKKIYRVSDRRRLFIWIRCWGWANR